MQARGAAKRKTSEAMHALPELEVVLEQFCDAHCLTPREKQVFLLVCSGKKNFVVAMELGLSEATIRLHITNLHRKLQTGSKVDLLRKAFRWWLAGKATRQSE